MSEAQRSAPPVSQRRPQYDEAAAWAAEMQGGLLTSRRQAWLAAAAASAAAILLGGALAALGPLRAEALYSVAVERQSGQAETARRLAPGPLTRDPALIDAFLAQYVTARESFDAARVATNYRRVARWSDAAARAAYDAEITRANPASPLAVYSTAVSVTPVVKSVSRLSPTQALIRFDTQRRDAGSPMVEQRGWQATVTFRVDQAAMRNADRFDNPLGFRVTEYRRLPDGALPLTLAVAP